MGKGHPEGPNRPHAASPRGTPGQSDGRRLRGMARNGDRPCGNRPSESRADRSIPQTESRRIPKRGPRPARSRRGRRIAAPRRRCQLRFRQYCRRLEGVTDADGAISRGGAENQPPRARCSAAGAKRGLFQAARRFASGRPSAWPADRHPWRHRDSLHLSRRRRVRDSCPARA